MAVQDQKLRTLYLMQIMLERTDENHVLNASDLCRILEQEYGMSADRRTIYSEMDILERYGLDIVQLKGKTAGYYVASRQFELAELKVLVDAVQSSKFITERKTRELISKLEKLCSRSEADLLQRQVVIYDRPKTANETIYYSVDELHTALYQNRKVAFQYAEWNERKELRIRKNGAFYIVSPWALTWDDENYYLIAYDEAADQIKHYRVDKMQRLSITEEERQGEERFRDFNLAAFAKKTFGMYTGRDVEVTLQGRKELAGVVIDRFGQDIWMVPDYEGGFRARVAVTVSRQFFGWITGIGGGLKIVGPDEVRKEYQDYLKGILEEYQK